jgi:phosphoglycolate phosphatase
MSKIYREILFDLDGTLIDPKEGITKSIQFALENMGGNIPSAKDLEWCIGPSLKESFKTLLPSSSETDIAAAVAYYRKRYAEKGMYEHFVYPGIKLLLSQLQKDGYRLFIATAKPELFAVKILKHFELASYFEKIYGAELDGTRSDKTELLEYMIETSSLQKPSLMIGDRRFDMEAALQNQVDPLGVTYGYGSQDELRQAGALHLCNSPEEIYSWITA